MRVHTYDESYRNLFKKAYLNNPYRMLHIYVCLCTSVFLLGTMQALFLRGGGIALEMSIFFSMKISDKIKCSKSCLQLVT